MVSSFCNKKSSFVRGFTLVELLISISIIGIVTAIVLVKYTSFDSTVLLKSLAYEIALTLREAQIKSVSVLRTGSDANTFLYPFGVTFTPGEKAYTVFRFASPTAGPSYDIGGSGPDLAEDVSTTNIERSMRISEVCYVTGGADVCDLERLDISFRRPEFSAMFYGVDGGGFVSTTTVTGAKIIVDSTTGGERFVVTVTKFGQISVSIEP